MQILTDSEPGYFKHQGEIVYSIPMAVKVKRYSELFRVHSYEVDATNTATLPAICQFFQEVASNHADELGFGRTMLIENQRAWMLSRLLVRMDRYPQVGDELVLKTWPSGTDRLLYVRDFQVESTGGEVLGAGVSGWVLMNMESRRPVHPRSGELDYDYSETGPRALPDNPGKLGPCEAGIERVSHQVRYNDLDMNNHVNNIKYLEWLMESMDPDFRRTHVPTELEINFLAEALYGHRVTVFTAGEESTVQHCVRNGDDADICRAVTKWKAL